MGRLYLALIFLPLVLVAQPGTTRVLSTVYTSTGSVARGNVEVRIKTPCYAPGGLLVAGVVTRKTLIAGVLDINLVPNDTCNPANTRYEARYRLDNDRDYVQEWLVPTSGSPVTIASIVQSIPVIPSQAIGISQLTGCSVNGQSPVYNGTAFVCQSIATNPMTSVGDLIRGGTSGAVTRLAVGSANQFLGVSGGIPAWLGLADADIPNLNTLSTGLTASRAIVTDGSALLAASSVTATELGYMSGVTSAVQTQMDGKVGGAASLTAASVMPRVVSSGVLGPSKLSCTGSPVTCTFYDDTAVTGAFTGTVRPGAGQSTTHLWNWLNEVGNIHCSVSGSGYYQCGEVGVGNKVVIAGNPAIVGLANNVSVAWRSAVHWDTGSIDLAVSRSAAGVLEINNGTGGQYRDLILRNTFFSSGTWSPPATGTGVNIGYDGSALIGKVFAFDYGAVGWKPLSVGGSSLHLNIESLGQILINRADVGLEGPSASLLRVTDGSTGYGSIHYFTSEARATGDIKWAGRSIMRSPADGNITLVNAAGTDFGLLQLGGTSSGHPALARGSIATQFLRAAYADGSGTGGFEASQFLAVAAGYFSWTGRSQLRSTTTAIEARNAADDGYFDTAQKSTTLGGDTEVTCNSSARGKFTVVQGGAGVADTVRVCSKDAADTYAWRPLL